MPIDYAQLTTSELMSALIQEHVQIRSGRTDRIKAVRDEIDRRAPRAGARSLCAGLTTRELLVTCTELTKTVAERDEARADAMAMASKWESGGFQAEEGTHCAFCGADELIALTGSSHRHAPECLGVKYGGVKRP